MLFLPRALAQFKNTEMDFSMQPFVPEHIQLITGMFYIQLGGFMITFGKQARIPRNTNRVVAKIP